MSQPIGLTAATQLYNESVTRATSRQLSVVDLFKAAATLGEGT